MLALYIILGVIVGLCVLLLLAGLWLRARGICPLCKITQLTRRQKVTIEDKGEIYENGVAQTPPMGWSTWNLFRQNIDETIIRDTAKAMKDAGLVDAGYIYMNLDDCWQSSMRVDGKLIGDFSTFPSGIEQLRKDINQMGMKLGLYTSNGTLTCEDMPASLGNEAVDARTLAEWGVEYFKYDYCHNEKIPTIAPAVEGITVGKIGEPASIKKYCKEAKLFGRARMMKDKNLPSGHYVGMLGGGAGAMEFDDIVVEEAGEYCLTVLIKKSVVKDKYLQVLVNDQEMYEMDFIPGTISRSHTGRHQVLVNLRKGRNTIRLHNPIATKSDSSFTQYRRMGRELQKATKAVAQERGIEEKPIVYSLCEWGWSRPWLWGEHAGNMWRTTLDIFAKWWRVYSIYHRNIRLSKYASKGHWNDPDMLEVGNGDLTHDENIAHFSLWCMMCAPLILGNDLRPFLKEDGSVDTENEVLKILTNKDLIAINQDALGISGMRVQRGIVDVIVKPLENDEVAVCVFNKGPGKKRISVNMDKVLSADGVKLKKAPQYDIRELWTGDQMTASQIEGTLRKHSVLVYKIKNI